MVGEVCPRRFLAEARASSGVCLVGPGQRRKA